MPPKPKFTKEELIDTVVEIVREEGMEAVVARGVGKRLGTTATPIFTYFEGMDELKEAAYNKIKQEWLRYLAESVNEENAFKAFGRRFVQYAITEPQWYRILSERAEVVFFEKNYLKNEYQEYIQPIVASLSKDFSLDLEEAEWLFEHMHIYTVGIISGLIRDSEKFTPEEVMKCQREASLSFQFYLSIKKGELETKRAQKIIETAELKEKSIIDSFN